MLDKAQLTDTHREPSPTDRSGSRSPRGARTRRRIMDATAAILAARPYGDLRITEIARAAEIAQSNFYTYFPSIEEVVLAIAREISTDSLAVYLKPDWIGEAGVAHARRLVEAAINLWLRHRGMFSLIDLLADARQGAFSALRVRQMQMIYKSFEAKVREGQAAGRIPAAITPRLAGYECTSIISSLGQRYELLIASGFSHRELVETTARLLHKIATGG
jgi:AcrR family transcriptional regulator